MPSNHAPLRFVKSLLEWIYYTISALSPTIENLKYLNVVAGVVAPPADLLLFQVSHIVVLVAVDIDSIAHLLDKFLEQAEGLDNQLGKVDLVHSIAGMVGMFGEGVDLP
jgi:hypothetical protein